MNDNDTTIKYLPRQTCLLCNNKLSLKVPGIYDWETKLGFFDILYCARCELGFTNPYPTEDTVGNLYREKKTSDFDIIKGTVVDKLKDYLAQKEVLGLVSKGDINKIRRILDFGTGNGRYSVAFSKIYPEALIDAVDYQHEKPLLLETKLNNNISYKYILDYLQDNKKKYNIIFLRHVLEHAHDPVGLINKLSLCLDDNGVMYVEVPNLNSSWASIFKKSWRGYHIPRHICHFNEISLGKIFYINKLDYLIRHKHTPIMGNQVAIFLKINLDNVYVQMLGILLYPLQVVIDKVNNSSQSIYALVKKNRENNE